MGLDPKSVLVGVPVPLSAMEDALLAWEMNGEPVPLAHGGPLRLIVPGHRREQHQVHQTAGLYRQRKAEARIMSTATASRPPAAKGDPSQPSVQEMSVKSWINSPIPGTAIPGLPAWCGVRRGLRRA